MFLKSSQEAAIYHTVNGEKRRGLLIDLGAASGLIGPEPLRDIMEHLHPQQQDQRLHHLEPEDNISGWNL